MSRRRAIAHFMALGAVLFAGERALESLRGAPAARPAWAAPAAPDDETLLVRAGLDAGRHLDDPVARWRLLTVARFVSDDPARPDDALLDEAVALGLHARDPVVRRRLVQEATLRAGAAARRDPPGEAALRAFHARHAERWRTVPRVRITQLAFASQAEARAADPLLRAGPPKRAPARVGAPSLPLPASPPPQSRAELAALFGPRFAEAVAALPAGRWSEPVPSAYGVHRVYVHERREGDTAAFETVRTEVREAFLAERAAATLRGEIDRLRGR